MYEENSFTSKYVAIMRLLGDILEIGRKIDGVRPFVAHCEHARYDISPVI